MSCFDPIGSRVPLHLRPDGKSDGEHLVDAVLMIASWIVLRVVPAFRRNVAQVSRVVPFRTR